MTWLIFDGIALAVLVLCVFVGRRRGFVAMALLLVGTLVSLLVAQHFAPPAARWVYDTYTHDRLVEYVEDTLSTDGEEGPTAIAAALEDITQKLDPLEELVEFKDKAGELWQSLRGEGTVIPFPDAEQADDQTAIELLLAGGSSLAEALVDVVLQPLVLTLLQLTLFLLLFVAVGSLVRLLIHLSRVLNHLPLLGGFNRFLGGLCGLVEGVVILYLAGIVLRLVAAGFDSPLTPQLLHETRLLSKIIFFLE